MPELPEVRTVCKILNEKLKAKTIEDVIVKKPKLIKEVSPEKFRSTLLNKTINSVSNRGKFIVFHLSDETIILSHLRMEGKYHFEKLVNEKHDHVVFNFTDGTSLYYNDTRQFGTFHLRKNGNYFTINPLKKMGPEPIDAEIKLLYSALIKKNISIKTALLDQTFLSGLGNIYVDEVL